MRIQLRFDSEVSCGPVPIEVSATVYALTVGGRIDARALELVGERWALLIIRDLMVRPRRYTDLLEGLMGIPTNVLSTRLKELEQAGIVERRIAPAPARGVLYALTSAGHELEPAVIALGRWGDGRLDEPRPGDIVTPESVAMSMRAVFDAEAAAGVTATYEIRTTDLVLHAVLTDGDLRMGIGHSPDKPDLVISYEPHGLPCHRALMHAAAAGTVELDGRRKLLDTFMDVFALPEPA